MPVLDHLSESHIVVSAGESFITNVDECLQLSCIRISPELIVTGSCPRNGTCNLHSAYQFIEGNICKIRVIV